jgi:hypothetical protein
MFPVFSGITYFSYFAFVEDFGVQLEENMLSASYLNNLLEVISIIDSKKLV